MFHRLATLQTRRSMFPRRDRLRRAASSRGTCRQPAACVASPREGTRCRGSALSFVRSAVVSASHSRSPRATAKLPEKRPATVPNQLNGRGRYMKRARGRPDVEGCAVKETARVEPACASRHGAMPSYCTQHAPGRPPCACNCIAPCLARELGQGLHLTAGHCISRHSG
ncbi:hypothetical protein CC86DRAFT_78970 [Ophiobolus disseminans]|uniref:Uncharacterized protein n=1 Tax=Ophiobolus disseminans TaxID=1469910 RepID=A0A6A6ZPE6_9PLEO|nr:hypothetical protein CC86DRAFT_78970 [Ophiobolus disseminans]